MTDKKPEILVVLDKWAKVFGYKNWKGLEDDVDADMLELVEVIEIATLAFEQGKLAGKKELVDGYRTECEMGSFFDHLGTFNEHLAVQWLKSQIKEAKK